MANDLTVNVRMYNVGELGDCFFLHFKEGAKESRVLIDCGSFRNSDKSKDRLNEIVAHVYEETKGKALDVVVGTHQHNDHVSGFVHCEAQFRNKKVDQVWLSWLDDPKDPFARQVKQSQRGLVKQLFDINKGMAGMNIPTTTIQDILGFYGIDEQAGTGISSGALGAAGDDPLLPARGIQILKGLGAKDPQYLSPGKILDLPNMDSAVKVYVLGPPRRRSLLFDKDPNKHETFDPHLAMADTFASKFLSAVNVRHDDYSSKRAEEYFPFNRTYKMTEETVKKAEKDPKKAKDVENLKKILSIYNQEAHAYRRIDHEWLEQADRLALYLNSYTNNSSLVLAFELVQSKKVLLFAADAQTGNWSSWEKVEWEGARPGFGTRDLLENTVLYKVGHHASHNATLVSAFEMMGHKEMVAMIPVDRKDRNIDREKNGWKMPAKNLYARLKAKTNNRVLMMDTGFAEGSEPDEGDEPVWRKGELLSKPIFDKDKRFVEYLIRG